METKKKIVIFILVIFIVALVAGGIYLVITPSSKQATTPSASVSSVNPCATYTDTSFNISRECILHMWNNIAGCPNTPSDIIDYYAQTTKPVGAPSITINGSSVASASRTLGAMKADAKLWATLPDTAHRTKCYGSDKSKWPLDECAGTNDNSTNLSIECLRKIWKDSGCINMGTIPDSYNGWWKQQTKKVVTDDMKAWATLPDNDRRTACYGSDKSKWPASPVSRINTPQYLRHLQNKNYVLY